MYQKILFVLKKIGEYNEISLCSTKDFSVLQNFVVFSKILLCSRKDCRVSEEKLSCVLPLWATVPWLMSNQNH